MKWRPGKDACPDQLSLVEPWQVKRLFWNHSTWWNQNLDSIAAADERYTVINIGSYLPVLGLWCNEIASHSRTQHKSQGFGVSVDRGSRKEYLQLLMGDPIEDDLMDGIARGWDRYGWPKGDKALQKIVDNFQVEAPYKSVPAMLELRQGSQNIQNEEYAQHFRQELDQLIMKAIGWHAELLASGEYVQSGALFNFNMEAIARTPVDVHLSRIVVGDQVTDINADLSTNEIFTTEVALSIEGPISQPYWLRQPYDNIFQVDQQQPSGNLKMILLYWQDWS
ncbi:MAG: hypothetical protein U5L96_05740 [Owenweeksia sp.]|nr:hypothetical protein [Owenweeksia sp.]